MARYTDHSIAKGMAAGLVGGLVASWTMGQFQALWSKVAQSRKQKQPQQQEPEQQSQQESQEPATLKAARKASVFVLHRDLKQQETKIAEPLVHYGYGTIVGGVYGALAEATPLTRTGVGLPFATALWLFGDEMAVPALGLSKPPAEYPVSSHLQALAAHLVYGATTDLVRRAMLKLLD